MALSGIQIYKLLPQTNCKECGFPTCLAFAMKLAAKQVELALCPYVSDEAKEKLSEAASPPVRPLVIKANGNEVKAGNEVVLFRHEKTFYNKPGFFIRIFDDENTLEISEKVKKIDEYKTEYVGIDLGLDGITLQSNGGDFVGALKAIRSITKLPLMLFGSTAEINNAAEFLLPDERPLIGFATEENLGDMVELALKKNYVLAIKASNIDQMVNLVAKVHDKGFKDLVLAPDKLSLHESLMANTTIRRMALKNNYKLLGYPIMNLVGNIKNPAYEEMLAAQAIGKYSSFIVMDNFSKATSYALLVLRENIYTNPQKPIQVKPGVYAINNPGEEAPVLVTTNFSITYFSVANELESSGIPAWLVVTDAEGMSVLTAWAAGKFDAERIAKSITSNDIENKVTEKKVVLPGHVAVLSGELEEELPEWEIRVGPREAVDIPKFIKQAL